MTAELNPWCSISFKPEMVIPAVLLLCQFHFQDDQKSEVSCWLPKYSLCYNLLRHFGIEAYFNSSCDIARINLRANAIRMIRLPWQHPSVLQGLLWFFPFLKHGSDLLFLVRLYVPERHARHRFTYLNSRIWHNTYI